MKFHFKVPDVRVIVEAQTMDEARERLDASLNTLEADGEWQVLGFNGTPEQIRACIVCGCADDMACEGGCSWTVWGDNGPVCSFDDEAHERIRGEIAEQIRTRIDDGVFV